MTPWLTIAIPTFDRNDLLKKNLAALLPQVTPDCRLIIIDNCSPTPVSETLADLLAQHPNVRPTMIRNRVNIGESPNLLRCYENCETEWLWVLGDDDTAKPDAVQAIREATRQHKEALLINFQSMVGTRENETSSDGLAEFVDLIPHFSVLTLISNNVVRRPQILPQLRTGHYFGYCILPHLALWLSTLNAQGGQVVFPTRSIVEWGGTSEWSRLNAQLGVNVLLDLPIPDAVRRKLTKVFTMGGSYGSLLVHLLSRIGSTLDAGTARYYFDQAWLRHYYHCWSLRDVMIRWTGLVALRFPNAALATYRRYRRMRGGEFRPLSGDEFRRM